MDLLIGALDPKRKSIAAQSQRVVSALHADVEKYKTRNKQLEHIVDKLQIVATESLENELFRLEMRKKELLLELERTDSAIIDRKARIDTAKRSVDAVVRVMNTDTTTTTTNSNNSITDNIISKNELGGNTVSA